MATDTTNELEQLHALIDCLSPGQVSALRNLVATMVEPTGTSIEDAPYDDKPVTEQELREIEAAHEAYKRDELIPHDEAMLRLGLD